jgi:hypothetical protein
MLSALVHTLNVRWYRIRRFVRAYICCPRW